MSPGASDARHRSPRHDAWLASAWGFAEATVFFIVPDVLLSWLALDRPGRGFRACGPVVAGALLGGVLMVAWGSADAEAARRMLEAVPGIGWELMRSVQEQLAAHDLGAVVLGPLGGRPYKLYALEWGASGRSLPAFLLVSIPARLARFLLVTGFAAGLRRGPMARLSLRACRWIHLGCWIAFYAWYLSAMPG